MAAPELKQRYSRVARVLWWTFALNLLVAVAKLGYGFWTRTLAVSADGYHSALDGCSNLIALVGITLARRPPDDDHHYGHQKYEILSSMGISFLLFLAAGQLVMEAIDRLDDGAPAVYSSWGFPVLIVTLVINFLVFRWERRVGEETASPILLSDAEHTRSDMWATVGAIVSVGAVHYDLQWVDLAVAGLIGLVIVRAAYSIIGESIRVLTDKAPIDASEVERVVAQFPTALDVHAIRTRGTGDQIFIDLSLHVDPGLSVREAHDLAHEVEDAIRERFRGVRDVLIHVEPEGEH